MINKEQHVFSLNLGLIALMNGIIALGELATIHSCYYSQIALQTKLKGVISNIKPHYKPTIFCLQFTLACKYHVSNLLFVSLTEA